METRKSLLRGLLEVQRKVGQAGTNENGSLINKQELETVRTLWRMEEHDWADSVPRIYRDVLGVELEWVRYETPAFSADEETVLKGICNRHELPVEMLAKLIELERSLQGVSRRASIQRKLASILEEEWRSDAEILEESPA